MRRLGIVIAAATFAGAMLAPSLSTMTVVADGTPLPASAHAANGTSLTAYGHRVVSPDDGSPLPAMF